MVTYCRFPDLNRVKLSAQDVDIWQPKHIQLESLGVLRNFSNVSDLQNTDPDLEALEDWVKNSQSCQDSGMQVDLQSLDIVDFTIPCEDIPYNSDSDSDMEIASDGSNDKDYVPEGRCANLVHFLSLPYTDLTQKATEVFLICLKNAQKECLKNYGAIRLSSTTSTGCV